MDKFPYFIIVSGPTGVGKTDFVDKLCLQLPRKAEIVNADSGQCYTPLSIGTAKPDYKQSSIAHHLFDIINEPRDYTVIQYRNNLIQTMNELWSRDVIPVIVGGSGFYLASLFFPPLESDDEIIKNSDVAELHPAGKTAWEYLQEIDPERARTIDPHDRYRIQRALELIKHGAVPSRLVPQFDPPGRCFFFFLTRERTELVSKINARVDSMMHEGWLDEVASLTPQWRAFLLRKKLIGYPELISYRESLEKGEPAKLEDSIDQIKSKTRAYAKRQMTFWRMLKEKLLVNDPAHEFIMQIEELDLTAAPEDVYLDHIREIIHKK